jgi:hypothetical protein
MGIESDKRSTRIENPERLDSPSSRPGQPAARTGVAASAEEQKRAQEQERMSALWSSSTSQGPAASAPVDLAQERIGDRSVEQQRMKDLFR